MLVLGVPAGILATAVVNLTIMFGGLAGSRTAFSSLAVILLCAVLLGWLKNGHALIVAILIHFTLFLVYLVRWRGFVGAAEALFILSAAADSIQIYFMALCLLFAVGCIRMTAGVIGARWWKCFAVLCLGLSAGSVAMAGVVGRWASSFSQSPNLPLVHALLFTVLGLFVGLIRVVESQSRRRTMASVAPRASGPPN